MKIKEAFGAFAAVLDSRLLELKTVLVDVLTDTRQSRENIHRIKDALVPMRLDQEATREALVKLGAMTKEQSHACKQAWDKFDADATQQ